MVIALYRRGQCVEGRKGVSMVILRIRALLRNPNRPLSVFSQSFGFCLTSSEKRSRVCLTARNPSHFQEIFTVHFMIMSTWRSVTISMIDFFFEIKKAKGQKVDIKREGQSKRINHLGS